MTRSAASAKKKKWGRVELVQFDENIDPGIGDAIQSYWTAWLRQDATTLQSLSRKDLILFSQQVGKRSQGLKDAVDVWTEEWSAYEKPKKSSTIAASIQIVNANFQQAGKAVQAVYWMEVTGGARWGYEDTVFVTQYFERDDDEKAWKLAYHGDSWALDYDTDTNQPSKTTTFEYDFVYPVRNLRAAQDFYTPLLGKPEVQTETRTTYNLEGSRFHLDTNDLLGHVDLSTDAGLPSGYAILYVDDIEETFHRLKSGGQVTILSDILVAVDPYFITSDPSGNVFCISQKIPEVQTEGGSAPTLETYTPLSNTKSDAATRTEAIMRSWLETDKLKLLSSLDHETQWFDDTRSKKDGVLLGKEAIRDKIESDWEALDRSPLGLTANMNLTSLMEIMVGEFRIVTYKRKLIGTGKHQFQEEACVTQAFDRNQKLILSTIIRADNTNAPVMELDYVAYPVTNMGKAKKFYTETLGLGTPYSDDGWYGYWSTNSVFGICKSHPRENAGWPRKHKTNGYISFWIRSAKETFNYLRDAGSTFPILPAINDKSGIDKQPGYVQVFATDLEGNGVVFTEYGSRAR